MSNFLDFSFKINNNSFVISIKNGFLSIIPLIIINSFLALSVNLLKYMHFTPNFFDFEKILYNVALAIQNAIPYIFIFLFTQNLFRLKHEKHNLQLSTFSVVALLLYSISFNDQSFLIKDSMILRAILVGILNYFLFIAVKKTYSIFVKISFFKENSNFLVSENIFLGILHLTILSVIYFLIFKIYPNLTLDLSKHLIFKNSLSTPLIYNLIILLPWLFGINGSNLVNSSYVELFKNSQHNIKEFFNNSGDIRYFDESFYNLYINIGGNGATLCLLIALFIYRKNEYKRFLKLAIIPSLFNINEIVVYGLPIVGNVLLIIPFILVPTIFTILTYFALFFKFIEPSMIYTSWLTPTIISGFSSSQGNLKVVIWQILLITIGTLIYLFFLKKFMHENTNNTLSTISSINDTSPNYSIGGTHIDYIVKFNEAKRKLNDLLNKGHLTLYFQPIVDVSKSKIKKMEVLVRIDHEELGIVNPYFISYFKTLHKIADLDYWVIEEAFIYGKRLNNIQRDCILSINISAETFIQKSFCDNIMELVNKHSVNPNKFNLEIVEEVCILDMKNAKEKILLLKKLGFTIAIDDFGTGYSSLIYLIDLPVNYIKIDRQFVQSLKFTKGETILKNIIQLCKSVGCQVIVEGVETEKELFILKSLSVEMIQGYYFFKPNSFENILDEIKTFEQENILI